MFVCSASRDFRIFLSSSIEPRRVSMANLWASRKTGARVHRLHELEEDANYLALLIRLPLQLLSVVAADGSAQFVCNNNGSEAR